MYDTTNYSYGNEDRKPVFTSAIIALASVLLLIAFGFAANMFLGYMGNKASSRTIGTEEYSAIVFEESLKPAK